MFKEREEFPIGGAGAAALSLGDAVAFQAPAPNKFRERVNGLPLFELAVDLGEDIGSLAWWRGLATMLLLAAGAIALRPGFEPFYGAQPDMLTGDAFQESRAYMIMPLAYGADTGRHMAATDAVVPLKASPERPQIDITATLGRGDSFERVLKRAGVGGDDAAKVEAMVGQAMTTSDIEPGTRIDMILGRRSSRTQPRPLQSLAFRARFDLNLSVERVDGALRLKRDPIKVDDTPLRVRGSVGGSLYRSARAAGAPADAVQKFLQVIGGQMAIGAIRSSDEFDLVVDYRRAETGEVEVGDLRYAGLSRDGKDKVQMLRWTSGGSTQWFEASGVGKTRGEMLRPVNGSVTSGFGRRFHPVLGYARMHSGVDLRAHYGDPIYAAADGTVTYSGRHGGHGNYVKLQHSGGIATGYAHMSRIAARSGQSVRRGQIIGYVGSTGLSTGPHLHYELYRGGRAVNPLSVKYIERAQLSGQDLVNFKAQLRSFKAVKPGAALGQFTTARSEARPLREIDRLEHKGAA
ncbi:M23 family metallopeptidase [Novosphingopyxis sp.]|uniref:M23 family metallopeptidase n=1 Tax=Novosphingopyxis sp. TaxID=2709690 RepID=UPI003B5B6A51